MISKRDSRSSIPQMPQNWKKCVCDQIGRIGYIENNSTADSVLGLSPLACGHTPAYSQSVVLLQQLGADGVDHLGLTFSRSHCLSKWLVHVCQEHDSSPGVVSTCADNLTKVKGLWNPGYLVLNFWPSAGAFQEVCSSGQVQFTGTCSWWDLMC